MIKTGDRIPTFELPDQHDKLFSLEQVIGKEYFVLYFYPRDNTPGCIAEACAFRDQFEDFSTAGARVIGISKDDPQTHKLFAQKYQLPFHLLSDTNNRVRNLFGIPTTLFGLIPGRVTFVCDKNGRVRYTFNSQLNVKKHVEEALKVLKGLS